MKIGILSQPSNFHCQKWASALQRAGAEVVVFTLEKIQGKYEFETISFSKSENYKYIDFYLQAKNLQKSLAKEKIDIVHPLHLTPNGTWGRLSQFKPMISAAMGADVFEYPPYSEWTKIQSRSWANVEGNNSFFTKIKSFAKYQWFKNQVNKTLKYSQFITADNQPLKDSMVQWFGIQPDKIHLIRWGVETDLLEFAQEILPEVCQSLKIPTDKRLIFSPRGAMAIYQADIIIDVFEKCLEANIYPDHVYVMLSSGYSIAENVKRKALSLASKYQNFVWVDYQIPRNWVSALWHICDIFISIPIYDGFSAAVSEGMWMGAIPLVNSIPGNMELVENERNGWVISQLNTKNIFDLLANKVHNLTADKNKFSEWNKKWITEHALLNKNAEQFINLLKHI